MARKIDHDERKREIAEKAVRLFSKVGYDNVSLLMIAAATGISRTIIYRYFCDKREVLDAAILTVTGTIEARCTAILAQRTSVPKKLEAVCHTVVDVMFENKDFLVAVFDYVVAMVRTGADMNTRIHEFTTGTRNALSRLLEYGIRHGDLPKILQVDRATDVLYSGFESCALRIVIAKETEPEAAKCRFSDIIHAVSAWK